MVRNFHLGPLRVSSCQRCVLKFPKDICVALTSEEKLKTVVCSLWDVLERKTVSINYSVMTYTYSMNQISNHKADGTW